MRRESSHLLVSLSTAALALSCARAPATPPAAAPPVDDARQRACSVPPGPALREPIAVSTAEPPEGVSIHSIAIEGARTIPRSLIEQALSTRAGDTYDSGATDADIARILELGAFSDVGILAEQRHDGLALIVRVAERPLIRRVYLAPGSDEPTASEWTPVLEDDPYDPVVVESKVRALQQLLRAEGHLDARAEQGAAPVDSDRVDLCLHIHRGAAWMIDSLQFPGASVVSAQQLAAEVDTHSGRANAPGRPFRADLLARDILKMNVLHWEQGLARAKIDGPHAKRIPATHRLQIELRVQEGPRFRVGEVQVTGATHGSRRAYEAIVAPLRGTSFARSRWIDARERLLAHHCGSTKDPKCDVTPLTVFHDEQAVIELEFHLEGS